LLERGAIVLGARELEQLLGVIDPAPDAAQILDDRFERLLLFPDVLRTLLVLPELRVFLLAVEGR